MPDAGAQVVTPDPSPPDFSGQRFVAGSDNLSNPADPERPTFATAVVDDPDALPVAPVAVHNHEGFANDQRFWLSVRVIQQDLGVEVAPEPGYAQMGLIAPGADAAYTVTFPETGSAQVAFEVDGGTDAAALLTVLQFALDAGFAAADLTGLGSHDQEIGLELANIVAEQYLADLPSFVPCANAVAAVQRGLADEEQFARDVQGCLESPVWQVSVDQVLARVAERDWFQQSLNLAGKAVPAVGLALKAVEAQQFATQVWGMYQKFHPEVPGAMVGTVAFVSIDTVPQDVLGTATAVPELSIYEVVGRAQAAVQEAGTYQYDRFVVDDAAGATLNAVAEVDIEQGVRLDPPDDGAVQYYDEPTVYQRLPDGTWSSYRPPRGYQEPLLDFLRLPATNWSLRGTEKVDGQSAYVIERTFVYQIEWREAYWIDATTFLPLKRTLRSMNSDAIEESHMLYRGFGAPVDVQVPAEALVPTHTPTPAPADTLASSSPTVIAEGFLQALLANDFEHARQYFPLDRQPDSWSNAFRSGCLFAFGGDIYGPECEQAWGGSFSSVDLISDCSGVDYAVVERSQSSSGVPYSQISFTFSDPCAYRFFISSETGRPEVGSNDQITVVLEQSTGQWYVESAGVTGTPQPSGRIAPTPVPTATPVPTPTPVPAIVPASADVTIEMQDIFFEPEPITIPANTDIEVALPNNGASPHDFNIDDLDIHSGIVEPGTAASVVINAASGEYNYYCSRPGHKEAGMRGTLVVE